ncbi:MAG TPA: SIMPL domain-containing protein [Vicinamibacterales bacterium]|nr:SIMPL domain-containing protein [Vicinamibacterales bacterium]
MRCARAVAAAAGSGLALDRILRIEEQGVSSPPVPVLRTFEAKAADAPPIAAGEMEVRAHVTVTTLLK